MVSWYWLIVVWFVTEAGMLFVYALMSCGKRVPIFDPAPELDESHAATRYAMAEKPGLPKPSAEEIEAARSIVAADGDCMAKPLMGACFCAPCPFAEDDCNVTTKENLARARAWLSERGIPIEEPKP